ncbi:hypothetical protein MG293_001825 [Ovis ammon polii]|uniref:Uncharacterized protein n=1 Tax=Ovis ammon polii TaxID=230172 RepID=A0AAD4URL1_OVIAM|nr:hypothetical protein MG293_001825 [Ovis ammon polii]
MLQLPSGKPRGIVLFIFHPQGLEEAWRIMSAVWKTPCGSNAMPEMMVKIIGSKHFRYLLAHSYFPFFFSFSSPSLLILTTIYLCFFKVSNQANVYCITQPTGDQSLSYIHGLPRRNFRDWSLEQMARSSSDQPKDIGRRPSETTREDTFLLALVRRELKSLPLSSGLLDKLQKELKILDPVSSGFLLHSQLSHLFLRLEVPLQLPTVKILCQRFSRGTSPEMVGPSCYFQYESEVNDSLLEVLKMALRATKAKLNIEKLNLSFRKEDRSFSGCLPPPKVRSICGKHGLHLTLSLLETLLNHQDLEKDLKPENPPPETSAPKDILNALKIRPISQPSVSPVMKNTAEECETWINRFRKLENALYLCDLSNTGKVCLIHNYNLIYNLSLSPRKIDQALRSFCAGENMLLEPALRYLKEL